MRRAGASALLDIGSACSIDSLIPVEAGAFGDNRRPEGQHRRTVAHDRVMGSGIRQREGLDATIARQKKTTVSRQNGYEVPHPLESWMTGKQCLFWVICFVSCTP